MRGIDAGHGVSRRWDVSDGSDGLPPLRQSHSVQTEYCFADVALSEVRLSE